MISQLENGAPISEVRSREKYLIIDDVFGLEVKESFPK